MPAHGARGQLRGSDCHAAGAVDLTDDEMAKLHLRCMVGGHAPQAQNELLYRFWDESDNPAWLFPR